MARSYLRHYFAKHMVGWTKIKVPPRLQFGDATHFLVQDEGALDPVFRVLGGCVH